MSFLLKAQNTWENFAKYPTNGIVVKINRRKLQLLREKSLSQNNEWQYAIEK